MDYSIHAASDTRFILTVPKKQFGRHARRLRDLMTKELYSAIAHGSHAPWGNDIGDCYQVETETQSMAEDLARKLSAWLDENQ